MKSKIILLGLNELNFDFIQTYISKGELRNFKTLFTKYGYTSTLSENTYELLEPWIQWVTVHTGKTYDEHKVFRLGDIVDRKDLTQIWEIIEKKGAKVAAVSPFNADNRLQNAVFFVPDPWTKTKAEGPSLLKKLSLAVSQAVNDNAQSKLTVSSLVNMSLGLIKYVPFSKYGSYFAYASKIKSLKSAKSVILDKLLGDVFIHNWKASQPDFSSLFLNTGAHLQHHYMFNSSSYDGEFKNPDWYCPADQDPLLIILKEYDNIIGELLATKARLIIATGLHQKPHKHLTFYWRLKEHANFLKKLNISFETVLPRMSRDFLIQFQNNEQAAIAEKKLASFKAEQDGNEIFKIDNRGNSLFVELIYPAEITESTNIISTDGQKITRFKDDVAFVAIKNGEHDGIGYLIDTQNPVDINTAPPIQLKEVFNIITSSY
ncbi:hypothetical protein AAHN97_22960 [Chitinophaga niabensis]|uniref:hypothetical protein n=1 Tax=Chitinophaga niabensis TaxID=536979 RepID=UPI0031B9FB71